MSVKAWRHLLLFLLSYGSTAPGCLAAAPPHCYELADFNNRFAAGGKCGTPLPAEGKRVCVAGDIDAANISDNKSYPQLPYQKFLLKDSAGNTVEVWVESRDPAAIFGKIREHREKTRRVTVTGTCRGFDMPVMVRCVRGLEIVISDSNDIEFKDE